MKTKLLILLAVQIGFAAFEASAALTTSMIDESTKNLKAQVAALPYITALSGLRDVAGDENGATVAALNEEYQALKNEGKADITFADVAIRFKKSHPKMADTLGVCVLSIAWEQSQKADHQFACEVRLGHILDIVKDLKLAGLIEDQSHESFKTVIVRRISSDKSPIFP